MITSQPLWTGFTAPQGAADHRLGTHAINDRTSLQNKTKLVNFYQRSTYFYAELRTDCKATLHTILGRAVLEFTWKSNSTVLKLWNFPKFEYLTLQSIAVYNPSKPKIKQFGFATYPTPTLPVYLYNFKLTSFYNFCCTCCDCNVIYNSRLHMSSYL